MDCLLDMSNFCCILIRNSQKLVVGHVNKVYFKNNNKMILDSFSTVREFLETAQGFSFKAKECVHVCRTQREDVFMCH